MQLFLWSSLLDKNEHNPSATQCNKRWSTNVALPCIINSLSLDCTITLNKPKLETTSLMKKLVAHLHDTHRSLRNWIATDFIMGKLLTLILLTCRLLSGTTIPWIITFNCPKSDGVERVSIYTNRIRISRSRLGTGYIRPASVTLTETT